MKSKRNSMNSPKNITRTQELNRQKAQRSLSKSQRPTIFSPMKLSDLNMTPHAQRRQLISNSTISNKVATILLSRSSTTIIPSTILINRNPTLNGNMTNEMTITNSRRTWMEISSREAVDMAVILMQMTMHDRDGPRMDPVWLCRLCISFLASFW